MTMKSQLGNPKVDARLIKLTKQIREAAKKRRGSDCMNADHKVLRDLARACGHLKAEAEFFATVRPRQATNSNDQIQVERSGRRRSTPKGEEAVRTMNLGSSN